MNHYSCTAIRIRCSVWASWLVGLSARAGLVALWLCLTSVSGWAQSSVSLGAILLKNDRVILGRVEPRGEVFLVHIADRSQVSLPKDQVQYVGRTVEDLYAYKLRAMASPNTGDHFKLTRWCMANRLLDQAVTHYQQVAKQAGTHPRVKQLAIELKNQLLEVPEFRSYLGMAPQDAAPQLRESAMVQPALAGGDSEGTGSVLVAGSTPEAPPAPQVVVRFGERIQPILINRCSQAACHGGQASSALRLIEPHSKFYAQTSASNLASVLRQVSSDPDRVSPLIAYATKAHGLQRQPGIAITETALLGELRAWVSLVQHPVVSAGAVSTLPAAPLTPTALVPVQAGAGRLKQVPHPAGSQGAEHIQFPAGQSAPTTEELSALERQFDQRMLPTAQALSLPGTAENRDPFDPAEFNRRAQSRAGM